MTDALGSMSVALSVVRDAPMDTKEDVRKAILLLDLVNTQARLLARDLGDTAARELILANAALVAEWLEVARSATSKT